MKFLKEQGVSKELLEKVESYLLDNEVSDELKSRIVKPRFKYYGKEIWEQAIAGILSGENILLVGPKATGKNILADNLAYLFKRPSWNISFHVNTDSQTLIGSDTFEDGKVVLRKGSIYNCALHGGFGVLDEINMARNDAMAVLHASLDYRRIIDVPGYEKLELHPKTRFIATMNYGYVGTRELNEALTSRFLVIHMPAISKDNLVKLLFEEFPDLKAEAAQQVAGLFYDIHLKSENSEISSKSVDLRGLISSVHLIKNGLNPIQALDMGITNKTFDDFEHRIVQDTIKMRIPKSYKASDFFNKE